MEIGLSGLKIYFLGGLGKAGSGSCILAVKNGSGVIIDYGLNMDQLGDNNLEDIKLFEGMGCNNHDNIYPDYQTLEKILDEGVDIKVVLLTHAHFDHIGAIHQLLRIFKKRNITPKIGGSVFTLAMLENYLDTANYSVFLPWALNNTGHLKFNDFTIHYYKTFHSIPGSLGFVLEYEKGEGVLFSGDVKSIFEKQNEINITKTRLEDVARKVHIKLAVFDTTNASKPNQVAPETEVAENIHSIWQNTKGRVITSFFSSNYGRLKMLYNKINHNGGIVGICGTSLQTSINAATWLYGKEQMNLGQPPDVSLLAVAGCQADYNSALYRWSLGEEARNTALYPTDTFVLSSRPIPNQPLRQARIAEMLERINHTCNGKVFVDQNVPAEFAGRRVENLHVSGHGYADEIALMLETLQPEIVLPFHSDPQAMVAATPIIESAKAEAIFLSDFSNFFIL
jgi:ribonuclease J